jgi:hypothetical protein
MNRATVDNLPLLPTYKWFAWIFGPHHVERANGPLSGLLLVAGATAMQIPMAARFHRLPKCIGLPDFLKMHAQTERGWDTNASRTPCPSIGEHDLKCTILRTSLILGM